MLLQVLFKSIGHFNMISNFSLSTLISYNSWKTVKMAHMWENEEYYSTSQTAGFVFYHILRSTIHTCHLQLLPWYIVSDQFRHLKAKSSSAESDSVRGLLWNLCTRICFIQGPIVPRTYMHQTSKGNLILANASYSQKLHGASGKYYIPLDKW